MSSLERSAPTPQRRAGAALALLTVLALAAGCSSWPLERLGWRSAEPDSDLAAQNLVFSLAQIPELHPVRTTVQVGRDPSGFEEIVQRRLADAGYGLQEVAYDQGPNFLMAEAKPSEAGGDSTRFRIAIGTRSVARTYAVVDGETVPVGVQAFSGVEEQDIVLDETPFGASFDPGYSAVSFTLPEAPLVVDLTPAGVVEDDDSPEQTVRNFRALIKANMYETLRSNYAELFANYEDVRQDTLIFDNDSMRLGPQNKSVIDAYAAELQPETDVLSVIGCSHGPSALENGNEVLAIGRANRVKEAFLFAGISHDQVLEEGCWAPHAFDGVMPSRGVLLTLKRRQG